MSTAEPPGAQRLRPSPVSRRGPLITEPAVLGNSTGQLEGAVPVLLAERPAGAELLGESPASPARQPGSPRSATRRSTRSGTRRWRPGTGAPKRSRARWRGRTRGTPSTGRRRHPRSRPGPASRPTCRPRCCSWCPSWCADPPSCGAVRMTRHPRRTMHAPGRRGPEGYPQPRVARCRRLAGPSRPASVAAAVRMYADQPHPGHATWRCSDAMSGSPDATRSGWGSRQMPTISSRMPQAGQGRSRSNGSGSMLIPACLRFAVGLARPDRRSGQRSSCRSVGSALRPWQ